MSVRENVVKGYTIKGVLSSQLFWIVTFAAFTFFAAQVAVPAKPVPFTLQTMLVLLSGAFLGARNGMFSQLTYLTAGAIGLPVFAGFAFGFQTFFGPTGGYLLAFPLAAYIVGFVVERSKNVIAVALSMIAANLVILLVGSSYLAVFLGGNFQTALVSGAAIFSVWGVIKIAAAVSIYKVLSNKYPKLPS
jgi:biotin transport system substrate-specific component